MSTKTDFLELTLPDNGEYVDNWDTVVNNNFEEIDDHLSELHDDLVGTTGDTGNLGSPDLQTRLDAALDASGKVKLDSQTDYTDLEKSKIYPTSGQSTSSQRINERLDYAAREVAALRFGESADRYDNSASPEVAAGIGLLSNSELNASEAVASPIRGFTPHSVVSGPVRGGPPLEPNHFDAGTDNTEVKGRVVYNIDGMCFINELGSRLDLTVNQDGTDVLATPGLYSAFVSRNEDDYNTNGLKYYYSIHQGVVLATPKAIDPRILLTHAGLKNDVGSTTNPVDGQTTSGGSTLTSVSANFLSGGVKAGDTLIIVSPSSLAGQYIVASDPTAETTIDVESSFIATSNSVEFYVYRPFMPAFGIEVAVDTRPQVDGRLYIGELGVTGGAVAGSRGYAFNGIYDSTWIPFTTAFPAGAPWTSDHYLGTAPSQIDVWVRGTGTNEYEINPTLALRIDSVDANGGGGSPLALDVRVPAFKIWATGREPTAFANKYRFTVALNNPVGASTAAFTRASNDTDIDYTDGTYEIRVILRR